jgi:hypothetical protein
VSVLVFDRTGSGLLAAMAYAAGWLPGLVGGQVLATYADWFPRRSVMIVCHVVRALLVATLVWPGMPLTVAIVLLYLQRLSSGLRRVVRPQPFDKIGYADWAAPRHSNIASS